MEFWKQAQAAGEEVCLATVVRTEGSSYRKPGARMLLTRGGRRVGTISGGCLEAEIQKKAWWLSAGGSTVQRYSSSYDGDSDIPYGLACGGTVWVLLERGDNAHRVLNAISECAEQRTDVAFVYSLGNVNSQNAGTRLILRQDGKILAGAEPYDAACIELAQQTLSTQVSQCVETPDGIAFVEYMAPPQRLFVFGAGDDAQPLVQFAHALGWRITVADERSHLVTRARFPLAETICMPRGEAIFDDLRISDRDAVVVMTHSYEQDCRVLRHVLPLKPAYLGLLGPRQRTDWLMRDIAAEPDFRERVHTPAGLNLGAEGPAAIALSIAAEIQSVLSRRMPVQQSSSDLRIATQTY